MDIHKPHAAKTPREFLIEIGTIVIGILIALGLDQLVEKVHEHSVAAEARETVRDEIAVNLFSLKQRSVEQACIARRLDEIAAILAANSRGEATLTPGWIGRPQHRILTHSRLDAENQGGRIALLPSGEQAAYGDMYFLFNEFLDSQSREQRDWASLRALQGQAHIAPGAVDQYRMALNAARYEDWFMKLATKRISEQAASLGIKPNNGRAMRALSKMHSVCVPIDTLPEKAAALVDSEIGNP